MRVLLKLVLDCPPDAAWKAIRTPAVLTEVSSPLTKIRSLEPDGFPDLWPVGGHAVEMKAAGLVPLGEQVIGISFPDAPDGNNNVRLMRDTGRGLSGVLSLVTRWEHTMAIEVGPAGRTLYRDQLIVEAGLLTPLLWPAYWAFWQWRALQMRRLAPHWRV
jgi:hypothetical protein